MTNKPNTCNDVCRKEYNKKQACCNVYKPLRHEQNWKFCNLCSLFHCGMVDYMTK